jgi:hypothetical protein
MQHLFDSGLAVDFIIAVMLVEAIVLLLWHRRTGKGIAPRDLLATLSAGLFLVLALRLALTGAGAWAMALLLAAGGIAHALDLWRRWRS